MKLDRSKIILVKTRVHPHIHVHVLTFVESTWASQAAACAREYSPGPKVEEPAFTVLVLIKWRYVRIKIEYFNEMEKQVADSVGAD